MYWKLFKANLIIYCVGIILLFLRHSRPRMVHKSNNEEIFLKRYLNSKYLLFKDIALLKADFSVMYLKY